MAEARDIGGAIDAINGFLKYSSIVGQIPWLHGFLIGNPIFQKFAPNSSVIIDVTESSIRERSDPRFQSKTKTDFLECFQKIRSAKPEQFSDLDLFLTAATNVFAGSDTTAIALRAIMYQLLTHPDCLAKLRTEIDKQLGGNPSLLVSLADASGMPYLQACIKEGMRLHPSVGMPLERYVPPGGAEICGRHLSGGTVVGVNPWVAGRDTTVYGPDAAMFRPERWLEAGPEQLKLMERNYLAFGAGSRICIGKNISLLVSQDHTLCFYTFSSCGRISVVNHTPLSHRTGDTEAGPGAL